MEVWDGKGDLPASEPTSTRHVPDTLPRQDDRLVQDKVAEGDPEYATMPRIRFASSSTRCTIRHARLSAKPPASVRMEGWRLNRPMAHRRHYRLLQELYHRGPLGFGAQATRTTSPRQHKVEIPST